MCEEKKRRIHGWDFVFEKRTKCDRNKNGKSIMSCVCVNVYEETKLNNEIEYMCSFAAPNASQTVQFGLPRYGLKYTQKQM